MNTSLQEEERRLQNSHLWHKKQCSGRILIGPWGFKESQHNTTPIATPRLTDSPEQVYHPSIVQSTKTITRVGLNSNNNSNIKNYGATATTTTTIASSSGDTSFMTAEAGTHSTVYNSAQSSLMNSFANNDDDEIDYELLGARQHSINDDNSSSDESIHTIRAPLTQQTATPEIEEQVQREQEEQEEQEQERNKYKILHRIQKPLKWRKSGSLFVSTPQPNQQEPQINDGKLVTPTSTKREPILYMRKVSGNFGSEPIRYKAATEARYNLLTEKWRQVEIVLTPLHLSLYSFSTCLWPRQKLEHQVNLTGLNIAEKLSLFLLSPLDYTFCLRYLSSSSRIPMIHTLTFKARSFMQCQRWYMSLYYLLPSHARNPVPNWCEVYVPILDLAVHLPLFNQNSDEPRYDVTLEDVKDAVIEIFDEDPCLGFREKLGDAELELCWTFQERAEWVYWRTAMYDPTLRIDSAICPQSIEQTHRLELRPIEHTPHDILLKENVLLQEPLPVEGFLHRIHDTFGPSFNLFQKMCYVATFDQYLFYIQPSKVNQPDTQYMSSQGDYISRLDPFFLRQPRHDEDSDNGESQRRMSLMLSASGVIDLTEVCYVRRSFAQDQDEDGLDYSLSVNSYLPIMAEPLIPTRSNQQPRLEIIMENGAQLKFEAYSSETCDLWVNYLADVIVYWKARKEAERDAHIEATKQGVCNNKKQYQVDTRIWSFCLYEQCRDIVKSGILYYQPRNRGNYSQKVFILTANGWLLFYDVYNRRTLKPVVCRERKSVIDIAGAYIYSGVDSTKKKKGANKSETKVAKVYQNGLSTDDEQLACLFSIWRPKQRSYFSTTRKQFRVYTHDKQLNPKGDTWTFLAQSRQEKEEWVWALNTVTEHLIRNERRYRDLKHRS